MRTGHGEEDSHDGRVCGHDAVVAVVGADGSDLSKGKSMVRVGGATAFPLAPCNAYLRQPQWENGKREIFGRLRSSRHRLGCNWA